MVDGDNTSPLTSEDSIVMAPVVTTMTPVALFSSSDKGRGPGPGRRKTKAKAMESEYNMKKAKTLETLVALQQQRQADFSSFVKNDARSKAFHMAAVGYATLKDDPEEAEKYKLVMSWIIDCTTLNDQDMPPLDGTSVGTGAGTGV